MLRQIVEQHVPALPADAEALPSTPPRPDAPPEES